MSNHERSVELRKAIQAAMTQLHVSPLRNVFGKKIQGTLCVEEIIIYSVFNHKPNLLFNLK